MKKFLILLTLFIAFLDAKTIEVKYKVTYGIFGKVGTAVGRLETNATDYSITIDIATAGLAKILSGNRKEHYISRGIIKDGLFVPQIFEKIKETKKRRDIKRYTFDHLHKKVIAMEDKNKYGVFHTHTEKPLNYYAKDDLLTLYFNLKHYLKPSKTKYRFYAVGGNETDGAVDIELLKNPGPIKKLLKSDGIYLRVLLHQKIFSSKSGELYIVMDEEGITKKGLLKDVILFGDIVGKLVSKKEYR